MISLLVVVLAACGGPERTSSASAASNAVTISGFLFKPEKLTVPAGTTVTWANHDDIAHTVTAGAPEAPSGAFDSGDRVKDETFAHAFDAPGTFAYFCKNHNGMRGAVDVT